MRLRWLVCREASWQFGIDTAVPPTPTAVLPGLPVTPTTPNVRTTNPATDLIARFLIGVGVVVLAAVGVLFWRLRSQTSAPSSADEEMESFK